MRRNRLPNVPGAVSKATEASNLAEALANYQPNVKTLLQFVSIE